jgi:DNA sulfur modification protein DndD
MWISRISLRNFKSYRNQSFEFPQPANGRNLVLIGGVNGYGKTTLLEAVYAGLYGEEALNHKALDRAGLKARGYGHFLENAFYKHALRNGEDRMEVIIEITHPERGQLRITRKWFFNGSGRYNDQRLIIQEQGKQDNAWKIRPEETLPILLTVYAIPPWLAPFFFFDGEKIAVLADEDRTGWILSGLESLSGVVLVKELREKLAEYSAKKNRQQGDMDAQRVNELGEQLARAKARNEEVTAALHELKEELRQGGDERDRLTRQLSDLAQGSDARTLAEVAEAIAKAEQQEELSHTALRQMLATSLPLQLVRRPLHQALAEALMQEDKLTSWEHSRDELQPRWQKFHDSFFCSEWIAPLCMLPGGRTALERTLSEAWESLFFPKPEGCAESHWHTYLQSNERSKLEAMRRRIRVSSGELRDRAQQLEETRETKWRLQQERIRLEGADGNDRSAEVARIRAELEQINLRRDELNREILALENELKSLRADIPQISATFERERKRLVESHPERTAAQRAERIVKMIDDMLPALYKLKLADLSSAATRIFRRLHHKDQVARIVIQDDGQAMLYSHEGTEITLPKSSGEAQLFVLSLVGALAEVTGYKVPLIVDTPLARLSEQHCQNLLDFWASDDSRQVILLAQDKEIGAMEYARLHNHVGKTYLLRHQQMGHGVGSSEALADQYFAGSAA